MFHDSEFLVAFVIRMSEMIDFCGLNHAMVLIEVVQPYENLISVCSAPENVVTAYSSFSWYWGESFNWSNETHLKLMFVLYRNQSIKVQCKAIDWSLDRENFRFKKFNGELLRNLTMKLSLLALKNMLPQLDKAHFVRILCVNYKGIHSIF